MTQILDWNKYSQTAREAAAEGCVLLRNENHALPLRAGETVSVFGRIQLDYYKSGTGSGGMVNVPYVHSIIDGLRLHDEISIYEPLLQLYKVWTDEHPFDHGKGWGTEPWCQEEMLLSDETVADAAAHSDAAIIILGRTAGEDQDNSLTPGSYLLTDLEKQLLRTVCAAFSRTIVVLNVGNIIDMSWVAEYRPSAVLYAWQGGMEGGYGTADVLCGTSDACGRLTDTIAVSYEDYPSSSNFGSSTENIYQEDVYVGYRYFETFAKEKVLYPFGFGLSYTSFATESSLLPASGKTYAPNELPSSFEIRTTVTNTGNRSGKEIVQIYIEAPQGALGKPLRQLCGFAKTKELTPNEQELLSISVIPYSFASYDDSGASGYPHCYVLEAGTYHFYAGANVRDAVPVGSFSLTETKVLEKLSQAMAPIHPFTRLHPKQNADGTFSTAFENAPLRVVSPAQKRKNTLPDCLPYTGDLGLKLADVKNGNCTLPEFLAQLSDADLCHFMHGEGMCSPKVTPGTAAAFGGVTDTLHHFGIPAGCCSDGPSGIRMDCGASAFSLPNGTLLACTFNLPLVRSLFEFEGLELRSNHIDALLGPGINIHRNPLNGRNFEYHSEDPFLTGKLAQAQAEGMDRSGVTGTLKHFCANNQEHARHSANGVISERALREIYLKPFELCIKDGHIRSVMTTYGPVNGQWTAGSYDLNTTILRREWGFSGMVMTDWWAKINNEGEPADTTNLAAMVRAQNDVFMVTPDAATYEDNLAQSLADGTLTRGELIRNAANICTFLLSSPALERLMGTFRPVEEANRPKDLTSAVSGDMKQFDVTTDTTISLEEYATDAGSAFLLAFTFEEEGMYEFALTASTEFSEHAQMAVTLSLDGIVLHTYSYHGGSDTPVTIAREKEVRGTTHYLKVFFSHSGLKLHSLRMHKTGEVPMV